MIRVAICDDEAKVRQTLREYLERFFRENPPGEGEELELTEFSSADQLLQHYPTGIDLLLLDIYMDGVDGMAAARELRKFDPSVCIIFITTMYQYALDGYAVRAFGFIKKPVRYEEFSHELSCAMRQIESQHTREHFLLVKNNDTVYRLPVSQILYCEVRNHSIFIHLTDRVQEARGQMKDLEEQLGPYGFFRCHVSFLVNSAYIRRIDLMELELKNGETIAISQRKRKEFLSALFLYVGDRI